MRMMSTGSLWSWASALAVPQLFVEPPWPSPPTPMMKPPCPKMDPAAPPEPFDPPVDPEVGRSGRSDPPHASRRRAWDQAVRCQSARSPDPAGGRRTPPSTPTPPGSGHRRHPSTRTSLRAAKRMPAACVRRPRARPDPGAWRSQPTAHGGWSRHLRSCRTRLAAIRRHGARHDIRLNRLRHGHAWPHRRGVAAGA